MHLVKFHLKWCNFLVSIILQIVLSIHKKDNLYRLVYFCTNTQMPLEYSIFNVLPKWYYYTAIFLYLIYWPMGIMISLVGSYDVDYANYYQIRSGHNITINNLENCFEYLQLDVQTNNGIDLQLTMDDGITCKAEYMSGCVVREFSSGPITIISGENEIGTVTRFSLICNTNFQETFQFYTNALGIFCSILAFVLIANCVLITGFHNLLVCICKIFRKPNREVESLTGRQKLAPPSYTKQREYQPIQ